MRPSVGETGRGVDWAKGSVLSGWKAQGSIGFHCKVTGLMGIVSSKESGGVGGAILVSDGRETLAGVRGSIG